MADPYDIIAIPGHPGMYARRRTVEAWRAAGSPRINSALRLYDEQLRFRLLFEAGKGAPADDPRFPDKYRLSHVRGIALDIDYTPDRAARLAAAGLYRPYSYEPWHWELPNYKSYPLVTYIPATAGSGATPFPGGGASPEEDDMFTDDDRAKVNAIFNDRTGSGGVQYYERTGNPVQEWMIIDPTLPPLSTDPAQDGYRVTESLADAVIWGRQYSGLDTIPVHLNPTDYVAMQQWARWRAAAYREAQINLMRQALEAFLPPKS